MISRISHNSISTLTSCRTKHIWKTLINCFTNKTLRTYFRIYHPSFRTNVTWLTFFTHCLFFFILISPNWTFLISISNFSTTIMSFSTRYNSITYTIMSQRTMLKKFKSSIIFTKTPLIFTYSNINKSRSSWDIIRHLTSY